MEYEIYIPQPQADAIIAEAADRSISVEELLTEIIQNYGELYTTYQTSFTSAVSFIAPDLYEKCKHFSYGDVLMTLTGENKPDTMGLWSGTKKPKHSLNSSALQRLHGKPRQKPSERLCLRCRN